MNNTDFIFGVPKLGWIDMEIRDIKAEVSLDISDAINNSLEKLIITLNKLKRGSQKKKWNFS